ncbi:MAG: bacteriohemerythrin [Terracidiphilus sp.]
MNPTTHGGELGVQLIDRDHREIAEIMLAINFNAARDADPGRQLRHLRELQRLVRSHFLLEEAMMTASRYPGLGLHTMRHEWMMEQIRRLCVYWKDEKNALTREPMGLLWESHIAHVESEDRAYDRWLDGARIVVAPR